MNVLEGEEEYMENIHKSIVHRLYKCFRHIVISETRGENGEYY